MYISVSFLFIALSILHAFSPNLLNCACILAKLDSKMHLISLLVHAKFKGNPIMYLQFTAVFPSVYKKKKKLIEFLKACISGMAGMTCFKIWYAVSPDMWAPSKQFGPVWTRDHSATNKSKIVHSCWACMPHFLGPRDTLPCVLIHSFSMDNTSIIIMGVEKQC